jgi:protein-disulfide isomerase
VSVEVKPPPGEGGAGAGGPELPRRRNLLLGGAAMVALAGVGVARWRSSGPEYSDLPDLPPFRRLVSNGAISAASVAFVGLQGEPAPDVAARTVEVRADLCTAMFGESGSRGDLPIAYFSDFNCPYCRILEGSLADVLATDPGLRLVRHELPLLGAASVAAAKAVLAADLQGGYEAMKARLLRAGLITDEAYLRAVSGPLGLDGERLLRDMDSTKVADRLRTSLALGQVFGLVGTPALVIGRTLVVGNVSARTLRMVVRDERREPALTCAAPV